MDIFEYAMQMELDGEAYYRQLVQKVPNKGLKTILSMLADDEVKHYNAIKKLRIGESQMTTTTILTDAKNIFVQLKNADEEFDVEISQIDLYKKAQEIEEKSRDFYLEKANEVDQDYQKELFLKLAEEEKKHYFLLENIIEFVSRTQYWLENAEFCHLEEY
jgi:rubrerythrin